MLLRRQNFVTATCRMDSRWFEFMRHVALTKPVCPCDLSPGVFSTGEMSRDLSPRNFYTMMSNSFQFAFWILFNLVYCLRLIKTINVFENNSKGKLKRIWHHWVKITHSVVIERSVFCYFGPSCYFSQLFVIFSIHYM